MYSYVQTNVNNGINNNNNNPNPNYFSYMVAPQYPVQYPFQPPFPYPHSLQPVLLQSNFIPFPKNGNEMFYGMPVNATSAPLLQMMPPQFSGQPYFPTFQSTNVITTTRTQFAIPFPNENQPSKNVFESFHHKPQVKQEKKKEVNERDEHSVSKTSLSYQSFGGKEKSQRQCASYKEEEEVNGLQLQNKAIVTFSNSANSTKASANDDDDDDVILLDDDTDTKPNLADIQTTAASNQPKPVLALPINSPLPLQSSTTLVDQSQKQSFPLFSVANFSRQYRCAYPGCPEGAVRFAQKVQVVRHINRKHRERNVRRNYVAVDHRPNDEPKEEAFVNLAIPSASDSDDHLLEEMANCGATEKREDVLPSQTTQTSQQQLRKETAGAGAAVVKEEKEAMQKFPTSEEAVPAEEGAPAVAAADDGDDGDDPNSITTTTTTTSQNSLFTCEHCGRSRFVSFTHYRLHDRSHSLLKAYRCKLCGENFTQKGNACVHFQLKHQLKKKKKPSVTLAGATPEDYIEVDEQLLKEEEDRLRKKWGAN